MQTRNTNMEVNLGEFDFPFYKFVTFNFPNVLLQIDEHDEEDATDIGEDENMQQVSINFGTHQDGLEPAVAEDGGYEELREQQTLRQALRRNVIVILSLLKSGDSSRLKIIIKQALPGSIRQPIRLIKTGSYVLNTTALTRADISWDPLRHHLDRVDIMSVLRT